MNNNGAGLDSGFAGGPLNGLANLAAQVGATAGAAIVLRHGDVLHIEGQSGLSAEQVPQVRELAFRLIGSNDGELTSLPADHGKPVIAWMRSEPLRSGSGQLLGVLLLLNPVPVELSDRQVGGLSTIAHEVLMHLDLRLQATTLSRAAEAHRKTEAALRDREAFFENLVERLPQNIFHKDLDGRFTFANKRFCDLVGRSRSSIIGLTDFDLFPAALAEKYQADDHRVLATGNVFETTEMNVTPDGRSY